MYKVYVDNVEVGNLDIANINELVDEGNIKELESTDGGKEYWGETPNGNKIKCIWIGYNNL